MVYPVESLDKFRSNFLFIYGLFWRNFLNLQIISVWLRDIASSTSNALVPVNDEGFSFLEVKNAKLRDELETLRRAGPSTPARG